MFTQIDKREEHVTSPIHELLHRDFMLFVIFVLQLGLFITRREQIKKQWLWRSCSTCVQQSIARHNIVDISLLGCCSVKILHFTQA